MEGHRLFEAARRDSRSEKQIDSSVFHSLFTACSSEGLGKLALKTLSKMRKMNFHPTRENLVCLMEAISKSKGEEGQLEQLAFVEEICFSAFWKQTHCFGMDLIACYARLSNKFDVVEPTLSVMRQMAQLGRLDKVVFTRAAAMFVEQQQIGQMARLCTQGMTEFNLNADSRVFLVMMKGFASLRTDQRKLVFDLYDHMLEQGMPIDKYILTVVLHTAKAMRKFDRATKIVEMLEQNPHRIAWDLPLLNELMLVASFAPDAPKLVERILREMDSRNIPTDVSSYNMRISLLGRLKCVDEAFELLQEMSRNGIDPNEGTVTSLLTACRAGHDAERALRVFELLDRWGLPPGNPIHSSLLESIFSQNRRSDLEKKWRATLAEWKQSQSTTPKPEPLETVPCPSPYRKRRYLTPQQLKKAAKPVSASRKAFLRRQSKNKDVVETKD